MKIIKYLGTILTKKYKTYNKNYKEIKKHQNKMKNVSLPLIGKLSIAKTAVLILIYKFNAIPVR